MLVFRIVFAVLLLASTAVVFWSWTPSRSRREIERLARERGIELDPDTVRQAARFHLAAFRGRVLGAGVVALPFAPRSSLTMVAYLCAIAAGSQVGAFAAMSRSDRTAKGEVRVARLVAPSISDYVPPALRWWAAAMATVVVFASGIWLIVGDRQHLSTGEVVGLAAIAVAAMVGTEIGCRLIVQSPQPAGSPTMLALRDELRAEQLMLAVGFAGSISVVALVPFVIEWVPGVMMMPTVLGLLVPLALLDRRRRTWVRDHLWSAVR